MTCLPVLAHVPTATHDERKTPLARASGVNLMAWNIEMPSAVWYTAESGNDRLQTLFNELHTVPVLALDTETTGLNTKKDIPLCWSLAWRDSHDMPHRVCLHSDVLPYASNLFKQKDKDWILCNAKYDTHILANVDIYIGGNLRDISVMHALLYEEQPHSLDHMGHTLLGWSWKDLFAKWDKKQFPNVGDYILHIMNTECTKLVEYASNDAYGTLKIYELLKKELLNAASWSLYNSDYVNAHKAEMRYPLQIDTLWDYYNQVETPFTKVLWKCERNGVLVDSAYLKGIEVPVRAELKEVERALYKEAQMPLNPNSPMQLRQYFFGKLGLQPKRFTKGGKSGNKQPSVDFDYLQELAEEENNEVAKILMRHRDLSKLLGTYVEGLGEAQDQYGRVHTKFNQDVARTGRLSSSNPNVQNIPRPETDKFRIRKAFVAEPGNTLIVADYEQLEMRLLAWAAGEQDMIDIFLRGWDIHMGNASLVFGKPYEDIAKAKKIKDGKLPGEEFTDYYKECLEDRYAAKAIGFG